MRDLKINDHYIMDSYIIRTPMLPIGFAFEVSEKLMEREYLLNLLEDPFFKDALFIASKSLSAIIFDQKFKNDPYAHEHRKALLNLQKYLLRSSARSTPFGLFAGIAIGTFSKRTSLTRTGPKEHRAKTSLGIHTYLETVAKILDFGDQIEKLKWYPNTSIFVNANSFRWMELKLNKGPGKYYLQSTPFNAVLAELLKSASQGKSLRELHWQLKSLGYSDSESENYLQQLVINNLLVSEIHGSVGHGLSIDSLLHKTKRSSTMHHQLMTMKQSMDGMENGTGKGNRSDPGPSAIPKIKDTMVNAYPKFEENQLDDSLKQILAKALSITKRFSPSHENSDYQNFVAAFVHRFGNKKIRLVDALDIDYGIGYPTGIYKDQESYVSRFQLKPKLTKKHKVHNPKYLDFLKEKLDSAPKDFSPILLEEKEVNSMTESQNGFRNTFFGLVELYQLDAENYVYPISFGGSSATVLHSRFSFDMPELLEWYQEILRLEHRYDGDCLHVEVLYLPPNEAANVAKRPSLRPFAISYLDGSPPNGPELLPIEDLVLHHQDGKLKLTSKSRDQEIIPYLSTAYDHSKSQLPIYRFLGDHQFAGKRPYVFFSWGHLLGKYKFLPRIVYGNVILSKALWKFDATDIKELQKVMAGDKAAKEASVQWSTQNSLPKYVSLKGHDTSLLINTTKLESMQMLFIEVKNQNDFFLEEYILPTRHLVRDAAKNGYVSEFQFTFY
ncbi:MAG: lantibiotic dehydratase family protein, partial [Allomuricauda sp.]